MSNDTVPAEPCTLDTCPLEWGFLRYRPTLAGNGLFAGLFGAMLIAQFVIGIRHKTWTYLVAMAFGLLCEVVGYAGRLQLNGNPFNFDFFIQYLVCLTIGPAFLTAAIYITFTRIVHSCSPPLSPIRPERVSIFFMTCDFICLVLQGAGGGITATSPGMDEDAKAMRQMGVDIMIGGLAFHVVSLFCFMVYAGVYAWRWRSSVRKASMTRSQGGLRWKTLIFGLAIAAVTIFARCAYRVAELRKGFESPLAHDEIAYMILEGTMVVIASSCLTVCHPGLCLDVPWKLPKKSPRTSSDNVSYVDLENVHASK